jgi:hypothetical protein
MTCVAMARRTITRGTDKPAMTLRRLTRRRVKRRANGPEASSLQSCERFRSGVSALGSSQSSERLHWAVLAIRTSQSGECFRLGLLAVRCHPGRAKRRGLSLRFLQQAGSPDVRHCLVVVFSFRCHPERREGSAFAGPVLPLVIRTAQSLFRRRPWSGFAIRRHPERAKRRGPLPPLPASVILSEAKDLLLPFGCNGTASSIPGSVVPLARRGFSHDITKSARSAFLSRCRSRELSLLRSPSAWKARGARKLSTKSRHTIF